MYSIGRFGALGNLPRREHGSQLIVLGQFDRAPSTTRQRIPA
jgi:hypothetical protein